MTGEQQGYSRTVLAPAVKIDRLAAMKGQRLSRKEIIVCQKTVPLNSVIFKHSLER